MAGRLALTNVRLVAAETQDTSIECFGVHSGPPSEVAPTNKSKVLLAVISKQSQTVSACLSCWETPTSVAVLEEIDPGQRSSVTWVAVGMREGAVGVWRVPCHPPLCSWSVGSRVSGVLTVLSATAIWRPALSTMQQHTRTLDVLDEPHSARTGSDEAQSAAIVDIQWLPATPRALKQDDSSVEIAGDGVSALPAHDGLPGGAEHTLHPESQVKLAAERGRLPSGAGLRWFLGDGLADDSNNGRVSANPHVGIRGPHGPQCGSPRFVTLDEDGRMRVWTVSAAASPEGKLGQSYDLTCKSFRQVHGPWDSDDPAHPAGRPTCFAIPASSRPHDVLIGTSGGDVVWCADTLNPPLQRPRRVYSLRSRADAGGVAAIHVRRGSSVSLDNDRGTVLTDGFTAVYADSSSATFSREFKQPLCWRAAGPAAGGDSGYRSGSCSASADYVTAS